MRCAHCKGRDVDIAHVRECSGVQVPERATEQGVPLWPASDAQIKYVIGLQNERDTPDEYTPMTETQLRHMEKDEVSKLIGELKVLPYKDPKGRGQSSPAPDIPSGRYALYESGPDDEPGAYSYVDRQDLNPPSYGKWVFYQVDKPTEGRWKGYTFTVMLVGAPGSYRKVKLGKERRDAVLRAIAADPQKAMVDYGQQSGVCGRCHSPLTDPESLARGIGPICVGKLGW